MHEHARDERPVEINRVMTAAQFLDFFLNDVAVEAQHTEANNEDRTLGDYLADLAARCERILGGEATVTDPHVATIRPTDRWVHGERLVECARSNALGRDRDPDYVNGTWEVVLDALNSLTEDALTVDGTLGYEETESVLRIQTRLMAQAGVA